MKVGSRALDPLGMDRVSDRITNELLMGITSMTQRARYYSFYTWAVYNVNKSSKISKFGEFAKAFYDRERAFMMACIAHKETSTDPKLDHSGILGSIKGQQIWRGSKNNVKMSFRFLANRLGGYGYYYRASLFNLGLTTTEEVRDVVTELGESLAITFERSIRNTEYFKKYVEKDIIPKRVLLEYGKKCCLCLLKENVMERELLKEILFGLTPELKDKTLHKNRRETLSLILYLIHQASIQHLELDEENFCNAAYFRQIVKDGRVIDLDIPDYFYDIIMRWRIFTSHDFFSYACESLFSAFLRTLEKYGQTGISLENFFSMISDDKSVEVLSSLLNVSFKNRTLKDIKINDVIADICRLTMGAHTSTVTIQMSEEFDQKCDLKSPLNEYSLAKKLEHFFTSEDFDIHNAVMTCCLLLLLLYIRFYYHWKKSDKYWIWLGEHTGSDLSPYRLIYDLEHKMTEEDLTLFDFLTWLIKEYVINQANRISAEKSLNTLMPRPIFWFHQEGSVYVKDRDYSPRHRNSRFYSCYTILRDLGLSEFTGEYTKLTNDGAEFLQGLMKGMS